MSFLSEVANTPYTPPEAQPVPTAEGIEAPDQSSSFWSDYVFDPLKQVLTVVDTPGRFGRTLLHTGDRSRAASALIHPQEATDVTTLRRDVLPDFGEEGAGFTPGNIADFVTDFAAGVVSDPLMYAILGATGVAKRTVGAANDALEALNRGGSAERAGIFKAFTDATGKALPENFVPGAGWKGLEPTFLGRLKAGETGALAEPVNQALASGLETVGDSALGQKVSALASDLADTAPGRVAVKWTKALTDWTHESDPRTAQGFAQKQAEDVMHAEAAQAIRTMVKPAFDKLAAAGIKGQDAEYLADLVEVLDPRNPVPTLRTGGKSVAAPLAQSSAVMSEHMQAKLDAAVTAIQGWTPEQRAAAWDAVGLFHKASSGALQRMSELGIEQAQLGQRLLDRPGEIRAEIGKLEEQLAQGEAGKIKLSPEAIIKATTAKQALEDELPHAEKLADAVPNYFPAKLSGEAKDLMVQPANAEMRSGSAANLNKARTFAHGELMGDPDLAGVPFSTSEIQAEIAKNGTKATGYKAVTTPVPVMTAVKKFFGSDAAAKEAEALTTASALERDPVQGYTRYFTEAYPKAILNSELQKNLANTFKAIPAAGWNDVVKLAREGKLEGESLIPATVKDIEAALKQGTGLSLEEALAPDLAAALRTGARSPASVFTAISGPQGWRAVENFQGGTHFLPAAVADNYRSYIERAGRQLPATLQTIMQPFMTYANWWKRWQTGLGPGVVSYETRNQIGDLFRMAQKGLIDGETAGDFGKLVQGWGAAAKEGYGDFEAWKGATVNAGKYGVLPLQDAMREAGKRGLLRTGFDAQAMSDAAEKLVGSLDLTPGTWGTIKRGLMMRDDSNRVAAFLSALRQGHNYREAAMLADETLFNYHRISPAADFLRRTGVAPFIAWQVKNIPFQLTYALEHPGEFAAMVRGSELLQSNTIPARILPQWLQDRYNIRLESHKDEQGHEQWVYVTDTHVLPALDLVDALKEGPGEYLKSQLGPVFKMGADLLGFDKSQTRLGERIAREAGGRFTDLYINTVVQAGKLDPRTGEPFPALGVVGLNLLAPTRIRSLDVQQSVDKASRSGASIVRSAESGVKRAIWDLNKAREIYGAQGQADPAMFGALEQRVRQGQETLIEARKKQALIDADAQQALDLSKKMVKAP